MHSNMVASDMDDCTMVGHTSTHSKPSQTLPSGAGTGARKRSSPASQASGEIEAGSKSPGAVHCRSPVVSLTQ